MAEIFEAVTLPPVSDTQTSLLDELQQDDTASSSPSTTAMPAVQANEERTNKYRERSSSSDDGEEVIEVEQNNETVRKHHNKKLAGHKTAGAKSETPEKLLKSLVAEYSRDERAKKNRRGRKSANLSKLLLMSLRMFFLFREGYDREGEGRESFI